jgi:hypothetical protein
MPLSRTPHPGSAAHFPEGYLAKDYIEPDTGLRGLVMRGTYGWCGYVGAPCASPLHGLEELEFECHFGITYAGYGDGVHRPAGYFYWGWDYAHYTDAFILPSVLREALEEPIPLPRGKDWSHAEVFEHVLDVLTHLREALLRNADLARDILHTNMR